MFAPFAQRKLGTLNGRCGCNGLFSSQAGSVLGKLTTGLSQNTWTWDYHQRQWEWCRIFVRSVLECFVETDDGSFMFFLHLRPSNRFPCHCIRRSLSSTLHVPRTSQLDPLPRWTLPSLSNAAAAELFLFQHVQHVQLWQNMKLIAGNPTLRSAKICHTKEQFPFGNTWRWFSEGAWRLFAPQQLVVFSVILELRNGGAKRTGDTPLSPLSDRNCSR